jgi:hypothetical protein
LIILSAKVGDIASMEKSRVTNLSTRYLGIYKNGVLGIMLLVVAGILYRAFFGRTSLIGLSFFWIYIIYKYIMMNRKVFYVEFDEEFLYLIQKDADTLIPLQNIQSVKLKTMGGLYEIKLYNPEIVGDLIYYKPSLLYPFNFKSKDAIANQLRKNIDRAKSKREVFQKNALMS